MKNWPKISLTMQISQLALATVILLLTFVTPGSGATSPRQANDDAVDFTTSILPILQQRCFECHGEDSSEGELRLDLESEALRGGHTGNTILGDKPGESELYLRITSDEDGYRMPKNAMPLSAVEIKLFEKWIEQGSKWPAKAVTTGKPRQATNSPTTTDRLGNLWIKVDQAMASPGIRYISFLAIPLLVLIFVTAISIWDRRKIRKQGKPDRFSLAWFKPSHQLAAFLLLLVIGALLFQFGLVKELRSTNAALQEKLEQSKKSVRTNNVEGIPQPVHPMHPKRLGGVYYRGNDERSPALFNGGFYRTATMQLWLTDENGNRLHWNDEPADQEMTITLSIERASGATNSLFSRRIMNSTFLKHVASSQPNTTSSYADGQKVLLREMETGEKWQASVSLGLVQNWRDGIKEGQIYLHHGNQVNATGQKGRIHFGINYKIQIVENKISNESEIWMGSIYNLNGRVLIPDENSILLDRWFDFRPIPEIRGSNTSDPTLLGVPEHTSN